MKLVVDANIIFSLLVKNGKTAELFFNPLIELYAPEFLLEEIEKHKDEILEKTKRNKDEFNELLEIIKEIVKIIPKEEFDGYLELAEKTSPDPNDFMYFGLALKIRCPLWSNDKELKKQDKVIVYSNSDLIKELET